MYIYVTVATIMRDSWPQAWPCIADIKMAGEKAVSGTGLLEGRERNHCLPLPRAKRWRRKRRRRRIGGKESGDGV